MVKRNKFDVDVVIEQIEKNKCAWSKFVVDTCFEKLIHGSKNLVPGLDRVPRYINFIDDEHNSYFGRIEEIEVLENVRFIDELTDLSFSNSAHVRVAFEHPKCHYTIIFSLDYINESTDDRNVMFYSKKGYIEKTEDEFGTKILLYDLEVCSVVINSEIEFKDDVCPALTYYSMLMDDLVNISEQTKVEVDIDFLRENYHLFSELNPDEDLITLPIKGNGHRIKSVTVFTEDYSNESQKYDFFEANISTLSKDDLNSNIQALIENGVTLPSGNSLVLLDLIDLYDKDKFMFRKLLNDGNLKKIFIANNIEGEKIRLRRIISGIENSLCGKVANKSLIEMICKNNIGESIPWLLSKHQYTKDDEYIDYLKKEYVILSKNEEQLEAIDKIVQMADNDVDAVLVQGPPGTGKTELILSLAKELTKKNKKVLITSNVHVACDNVVERLKNNKDIVLKRYTSTYGDQYEKELVENQKRYIENQVLAGFKYEDKSISSIDIYNELCQKRKDLLNKKTQMVNSKKEYDSRIKPYNDMSNKKVEIKKKIDAVDALLIEVNNEIKIREGEIEKVEIIIDDYKGKINKLENKRQEQEAAIDKKKEKLNALKKELESLYNDNELLENRFNEHNGTLNELVTAINDVKEQLSLKKEYIGYLENTNPIKIKNAILSYVFNNNELINMEIMIAGNYLDEIDFLMQLLNAMKNDEPFWENGADLNISTLEYIVFNVAKSKYAIDYLSSDTLLILEDIYEFYKLEKVKKRVMKLIPFFKKNGHNYYYYKECISQLNGKLKHLKFNYKEIITNIVDKVITKDRILNLAKITKSDINKLKCEIIEKETLLEKYTSDNSELEAKIKSIKDSIKDKTSDVYKCQNNIDLATHELSSDVIAEIKKNNEQLEPYLKEFDEYNLLKKEKINELDKLNDKNDDLYEKLENTNKKIKQIEFELSDLIGGYGSFIDRYAIDLADINRKIDGVTDALSSVDSKLETMQKNGWKKEDALDFIFRYIGELENIVGSDSTNDYFTGIGRTFTNMFSLLMNNEGSLISMTTSQVASLLNNTDSDGLTFDYAIIDEASKCKFEDLIISLPRVKHLVLIGDFMQLDPMYDEYKNINARFKSIINENQWENINKSSFSLLLSKFVEYNEKNHIEDFSNNPFVAVMKRQYRMNKGIFKIIQPIYSIHKGFELIDEKQMTSNDIKCIEIGGSEIEHGTSYYNVEEGDTIVSILNALKENKDKYPKIKTIGIITGYKAQQNYLVRKLKNFKIEGTSVQIGTFDRFQGREYDLVIVSLVRTDKLGFTNNIRRMNVAFSRARNHLLVLGNFTSLLNIAMRTSKTYSDEYSNGDAKENSFVVENLIPNLYDMKEEFVSTDEVVNSVKSFLKEADYE